MIHTHTHTHNISLRLLGGTNSKESPCNARDLGSIPGLERSPGESNGYLHQYSYLENFMTQEPGRLQQSDMTE